MSKADFDYEYTVFLKKNKSVISVASLLEAEKKMYNILHFSGWKGRVLCRSNFNAGIHRTPNKVYD